MPEHPAMRKTPFSQIRIDNALAKRLACLGDSVGHKLNHFAEAALAEFADIAETEPNRRKPTRLLAMIEAARSAEAPAKHAKHAKEARITGTAE
jgi:hypothetical protein